MQQAHDRNHRIPAATRSDPHHGDLSKGAFLRRRAAYRLQADAIGEHQVGAMAAVRPTA